MFTLLIIKAQTNREMKAAIIILSVVVVGLVALLWWLMKAFGDTFKWN